MKYLISIFLWVISTIYFSFLLIFFIICSYIFDPETYDPWLKKMLRFLFKIMRIKVVVEGAEKLDQNKNYLFMGNHVSLFDVPLLGGFVPFLVRGLEADRQFKWPIYGWLVRRIGNIPIARENIFSSIKSIRQIGKKLEKGKSMIIMPEGHRTLTGEIGTFMKLPFFIAKQAKIELVPMGLSGLYSLKKKGSWLISPNTIKLKFGKVITIEQLDEMSTVQLRDFTKQKISELIEYP